MKYYRLELSSENGIQAVVNNPPKELLEKKLYSEYKFDFLDCILLDLDKGAKLTDVLYTGTINLKGFPIKNQFVDLIKRFNLYKIQFVDILNKNLEGYKFMFFNSDLTHYIDYTQSDFILIEDMLGEITEINTRIIGNRNEVLKAYEEYCEEDIFKRLVPRNGYVFTTDFSISEYDVFRIGHFDLSFYISERVKLDLEKHNITGVEFIEAPIIPSKSGL